MHPKKKAKRARPLPRLYRDVEIRRLRGELLRDSFPRLQMFLLVALTGGAGFVASFLLLRAGVVEMWLRYLAAFGAAYLAFLALLWLWLRTRADDYLDAADIPLPSSSGDGAAHACYSGKGGSFDGGGASGSYEIGGDASSFLPESDSVTAKAFEAAGEADEFAIPLALIVVAAAMLFSSIFMIQSAPVLFAELLVDGVLSASLFRRLRGLQTRHWLQTAVRRTALPFAMTAVVVSASGWAMAEYAPEAHSIGEFISEMNRAG